MSMHLRTRWQDRVRETAAIQTGWNARQTQRPHSTLADLSSDEGPSSNRGRVPGRSLLRR